MKPEEIEEMKADMEAGTNGPFTFRTDGFTGDCGITAPGCSVVIECFADIRHHGEGARDEAQANARRIARVPAMEAEILRLREALTWHPIETAPKDGREILGVYAPTGPYPPDYSIVAWEGRWLGKCDSQRAIESQGDFGTEYIEPFLTHWMPLPPPPDGEAP